MKDVLIKCTSFLSTKNTKKIVSRGGFYHFSTNISPCFGRSCLSRFSWTWLFFHAIALSAQVPLKRHAGNFG